VIVYEEYEDGGATKSWIKRFDGGIKEDRWLYLTSFKIPRCPNEFKATHKSPMSLIFETFLTSSGF
jgi:hypothetical protein